MKTMHMRPGANRRGFTVMELLVTMGVISLLIPVIFALTMQSVWIFRRTSERNVVLTGQTLAFSKIERELREAYCVNSASSATVLSFTPPAKVSGTNPPVNQVQLAADGTFTPVPSSTTVTYFLGDLYKGSGAGTPCDATDPLTVSVGGKPNPGGHTLFRFDSTVQPTNGLYRYPHSSPARYVMMTGISARNGRIFSYGEPVNGVVSWGNASANTRVLRVVLLSPLQEHTRSGIQTVNQVLESQFSLRSTPAF